MHMQACFVCGGEGLKNANTDCSVPAEVGLGVLKGGQGRTKYTKDSVGT